MDCGSQGGVISSIDFASFGTPRSQCQHMGTYQCDKSGVPQVIFLSQALFHHLDSSILDFALV
jgi:hypothetical protein